MLFITPMEWIGHLFKKLNLTFKELRIPLLYADIIKFKHKNKFKSQTVG